MTYNVFGGTLNLAQQLISVAGPCLWDCLPVTLQIHIFLVQFKRVLKTLWFV